MRKNTRKVALFTILKHAGNYGSDLSLQSLMEYSHLYNMYIKQTVYHFYQYDNKSMSLKLLKALKQFIKDGFIAVSDNNYNDKTVFQLTEKTDDFFLSCPEYPDYVHYITCAFNDIHNIDDVKCAINSKIILSDTKTETINYNDIDIVLSIALRGDNPKRRLYDIRKKYLHKTLHMSSYGLEKICKLYKIEYIYGKDIADNPNYTITILKDYIKETKNMRVRGKVDKNQKDIVKYLRGIKATVQSLASVGKGVPDILVGCNGQNYLFEIKNGNNGLTDDQTKWHNTWQGKAYVIYTIDELKKIIGIE